MKNTLLVGETKLQEWNLEDIFDNRIETSKKQDIERLLDYEWENKVGRCCDGLTYLEVERFDYMNGMWK